MTLFHYISWDIDIISLYQLGYRHLKIYRNFHNLLLIEFLLMQLQVYVKRRTLLICVWKVRRVLKCSAYLRPGANWHTCPELTNWYSSSCLILSIKPFFYMTKNSRQKFKYLENAKRFKGEIKIIFHHFQRAFSCQKLSKA